MERREKATFLIQYIDDFFLGASDESEEDVLGVIGQLDDLVKDGAVSDIGLSTVLYNLLLHEQFLAQEDSSYRAFRHVHRRVSDASTNGYLFGADLGSLEHGFWQLRDDEAFKVQDLADQGSDGWLGDRFARYNANGFLLFSLADQCLYASALTAQPSRVRRNLRSHAKTAYRSASARLEPVDSVSAHVSQHLGEHFDEYVDSLARVKKDHLCFSTGLLLENAVRYSS